MTTVGRETSRDRDGRPPSPRQQEIPPTRRRAGQADDWRAWSDQRLRLLVQRTADEADHHGYPVAAEVDALLATR